MTLPEGWPTLQEIMRATAHLANGDAPDWHVNYRLTNAASFAVTAYPALGSELSVEAMARADLVRRVVAKAGPSSGIRRRW